MKVKQGWLFLLVVFIVALLTSAIEVKAMSTGFSTEELADEEQNAFLSNVDVTLLTKKPPQRGILCFDVNKQGMIAVGQEGPRRKEICVYTKQGEFLYGCSFNCNQSFGIELDNECINIYFVRSDVIISIDSDGNILDVKKVQNTIDNNTYRNMLLYSTRRTIDGTTYIIKNDMGIFNWIALSYSQIVIIDDVGAENIIYDVSSTQFFKTVVLFVVVLLITGVLIILVWRVIRLEYFN